MQPTKKPMNWLLIIIGLCCLGGICSSVVTGAFLFFAKSRDKSMQDTMANIDAQIEADLAEEMANLDTASGESTSDDLTSSDAELPAQPDGQRWVDPMGRYSIVFPYDWEIMDPSPEGLEVAAITALETDTDDFAENVNIVLETIPPGYSGEEYIEAMEAGLETVDNYTVHDRGEWAHTGEAGEWIEYTANFDPSTTSHNYVFVVTEPGQAYIITASSTGGTFEKWKDQLRAIAETFRLE